MTASVKKQVQRQCHKEVNEAIHLLPSQLLSKKQCLKLLSWALVSLHTGTETGEVESWLQVVDLLCLNIYKTKIYTLGLMVCAAANDWDNVKKLLRLSSTLLRGHTWVIYDLLDEEVRTHTPI